MTGNLIDLVLHVDRSVAWIFHEWGWVAWALVFLVVFIETGVVVFPFLPGDSLLFACGAFAATQGEPVVLFLVLIGIAALVGNTTNWFIGRQFGALLLKDRPGKRPWIKPEHLEETHAFFERWGGWAVTLSRFFPIIRTITPFVAGVGRMRFVPFSAYNALGGIAWTVVFVLAGFFFGNLPWVKENFSLVVVALVLVPSIPAFIGFLRTWKKPSKPAA
jgi:membrane-associated protein